MEAITRETVLLLEKVNLEPIEMQENSRKLVLDQIVRDGRVALVDFPLVCSVVGIDLAQLELYLRGKGFRNVTRATGSLMRMLQDANGSLRTMTETLRRPQSVSMSASFLGKSLRRCKVAISTLRRAVVERCSLSMSRAESLLSSSLSLGFGSSAHRIPCRANVGEMPRESPYQFLERAEEGKNLDYLAFDRLRINFTRSERQFESIMSSLVEMLVEGRIVCRNSNSDSDFESLSHAGNTENEEWSAANLSNIRAQWVSSTAEFVSLEREISTIWRRFASSQSSFEDSVASLGESTPLLADRGAGNEPCLLLRGLPEKMHSLLAARERSGIIVDIVSDLLCPPDLIELQQEVTFEQLPTTDSDRLLELRLKKARRTKCLLASALILFILLLLLGIAVILVFVVRVTLVNS